MQSTYDQIQYYHLDQRQRTALVVKLGKVLAAEPRIRSAWVFGSFTRQGGIRDIDVAVEAVPALEFKEYLDLNVQIELELGIPTDLVELRTAPPSLRENITKNGIRVK